MALLAHQKGETGEMRERLCFPFSHHFISFIAVFRVNVTWIEDNCCCTSYFQKIIIHALSRNHFSYGHKNYVVDGSILLDYILYIITIID